MVTDTFPIEPDYGYDHSALENMLVGAAAGGREYLRPLESAQPILRLTFSDRAASEWASIDQFYRQQWDDECTFHDIERDVDHTVVFASPPRCEENGNERFNVSAELQGN